MGVPAIAVDHANYRTYAMRREKIVSLLAFNRRGSDFINVTAWLSMAISLSWFLMSAIYLGVFLFWVPLAELQSIVGILVEDGVLPLFVPWVLGHLVYYLAGALICAPILFVGALQLLQRREWARRFFIVLISLSVVSNMAPLAALALHPEYLFPPILLVEDPQYVLRYMLGFLIMALSGLLAAMAWKINSPQIRCEFLRWARPE